MPSATRSTPSPSRGRSTELAIVAEGSVETSDTTGVLSGQIERFPPVVFLRETALTAPDAAIRDFADEIAGRAGASRLELMHALMDGMGKHMRLRTRRDRHRHQRHRGIQGRPGRLPGLRPRPDRRRPPPGHSCPLRQRLLAQDRRPRQTVRRPRLGGGADRRPRLGGLRRRQRHVPHRRLCAAGDRPRLSGRGAGPRRAFTAAAARNWPFAWPSSRTLGPSAETMTRVFDCDSAVEARHSAADFRPGTLA